MGAWRAVELARFLRWAEDRDPDLVMGWPRRACAAERRWLSAGATWTWTPAGRRCGAGLRRALRRPLPAAARVTPTAKATGQAAGVCPALAAAARCTPHDVGRGAVHSELVRQVPDLGTRVQGVCGWTGRQGPHAPRPGSPQEDCRTAGT